MKDLAIWLGKYVGVSYIHAVCLEEYAKHTLAKMAYSEVLIGRHHRYTMTVRSPVKALTINCYLYIKAWEINYFPS